MDTRWTCGGQKNRLVDTRWTFGGQKKISGEKFKKFPIVYKRSRNKLIENVT
jgi:hypothetical protein